jgi:hypothetical protein
MILARPTVLTLAAALLIGSQLANACSCQGPPTTDEGIIDLMSSSDVVLLGLLEEGNVRVWLPEGEVTRELSVTIMPIEWFKGAHQEAKVQIEFAPLDCLSGFYPGNSVLVFASQVNGRSRASSHSCRMYVYELAQPEYPTENAELRARLAPALRVLRSRSW